MGVRSNWDTWLVGLPTGTAPLAVWQFIIHLNIYLWCYLVFLLLELCLWEMNKNFSLRNLYVNICSSPIHYCCWLDITQMYTNCCNQFIQWNIIQQLKGIHSCYMHLLGGQEAHTRRIADYAIPFIWHSWKGKAAVMDKREVVTPGYGCWERTTVKV